MRYLIVALIALSLPLAGCEGIEGPVAGPSGVTADIAKPAAALPVGVTVADLKAPIMVPAAGAPITVDGKLSEPAWKNAIAFTGFVGGKEGKAVAVQSRVLVAYDKDNLYIAVVCDEPDTDKLVAKAAARDDKLIWAGDDHIEVYLDPAAAKGRDYYGFFITPKNVVYDRRRVEEWDGRWASGVSVIDGKAWVVEMAIPWSEIGVKEAKAGHKFGLMVARDRRAGTGGYSYMVNCNDEAKDTQRYPTLQLN